VLPRLLDALRKKHMRYIGIGGGRRAMNTIYVGNLVEAMFLAAEKPGIEGHVYNLTDGEPTSKRRFLTALADGVGVPRPRPLPAPLWLAKGLAAWQESAARRRGATTAPTLTRARVKFLGFNLDFNIEKARRELGYRPSTSFDEAMRITTAWYKRQP
jgi:nucleoside-diphosphate-sugar epimerase